MTFQQLGLSEPLLKALKRQGYETPTPIQEQSIPVVLSKRDLLGIAQTGTGKTAAFALPALQLIHKDPSAGYKHIRALILVPTRELACQVYDSFQDYGRYTGLSYEVIFGGVSQTNQTIALRNGVDILIATPGRLLDLMNQGYIYLDYLEFFVLDEADRMLDMGFIHDIRKIIKELPDQRQTLFFSATMPPPIAELAGKLLRNPERVEVTPVSSTAEKVDQTVYMVDKGNKPALLAHIIKEQNIARTLVFTRTKHGADRIAKYLSKVGIKADAIHGDKVQSARQRALNNFKSGLLKVLVATDIAARGIDVDSLTHVINFDLPNVPETYVHRIGRTGRAGASGVALSFCDREERAYLKDIVKLTGQDIAIAEDHPFKLEMGGHVPVSADQKNKPRSNGRRWQQGSRPNGNRPNGNRSGGARPAGSAPARQNTAS